MPGKDSSKRRIIPKTTTVTILGSGTCAPSLIRSSCSVLVDISHQKLLFDIGAGTMARIMAAGVEIFDISHLFLSHFHPDHTGELASFLFSYKYGAKNRAKTGLTIIGGKGLLKFYKGLCAAYGSWIAPDDTWPLNFIEMDTSDTDQRDFEGFSVSTIPVDHNPESIAFRLIGPGEISLVYSGDTDYCQNLVTLARDVDLLICESSTPDAEKSKGHMTPGWAGKTARRARARKLVLTHFYPECDDADMEKECRKEYTGPLVLARDLMDLRIPG
jgi:ribonuclease BN (tRNA processing enzyme)